MLKYFMKMVNPTFMKLIVDNFRNRRFFMANIKCSVKSSERFVKQHGELASLVFQSVLKMML